MSNNIKEEVSIEWKRIVFDFNEFKNKSETMQYIVSKATIKNKVKTKNLYFLDLYNSSTIKLILPGNAYA